jgi:hypothetical protein
VSALERPSEILLVAVFETASGATSAAFALRRRGLGVQHLAVLAPASSGSVPAAGPEGAVWHGHLTHLGAVVATGSLAVELEGKRARHAGAGRLAMALRRVGLGADDVAPIERAVRAGQATLLAAVPADEVTRWDAVLQKAGVASLAAHVRLAPWPPEPSSLSRSHGPAPARGGGVHGASHHGASHH